MVLSQHHCDWRGPLSKTESAMGQFRMLRAVPVSGLKLSKDGDVTSSEIALRCFIFSYTFIQTLDT